MENAIDTNAGGRNRAGSLNHSAPALAWALAQSPGSAIDKLVLIALAERYDWRVKLSFPSRDWIIDWAGVDRKTVIRALRRLEAASLIRDSGQRLAVKGEPSRTAKAYRLAMDCGAEAGL